MKKKILVYLILILSLLNVGCERIQTNEKNIVKNNKNIEKNETLKDYYKLVKNSENEYILFLYDKNKKIVHKEIYPKEPRINELDNHIIRIEIWVGSPLYYTHFFDTKTGRISAEYENISLYNNEKVIYMNEKWILVVSNAFDKNLFYKEIKRNFSPTTVPSNAIVSAKFNEPNKLEITYLEGNGFKEKTEVIDLSINNMKSEF